jgi:uncharacterized delta-60 repeat protein
MKTFRFAAAFASFWLVSFLSPLRAAPLITSKPASVTVASGGATTLAIAATGTGTVSYQWQLNGNNVATGTTASLALTNVQSDQAGVYRVVVSDSTGSTISYPAVVGVTTSSKVIGGGSEVGSNIVDGTGNVYDQILMTGPAVTVTADAGQLTKVNFIDANATTGDDIVVIEFSGAGAMTINLDGASGPAAPVKYNQPTVNYMKGIANIVIAGADDTTNVSIYSVGTANATNQSIFPAGTTYDGFADIASVAVLSSNGKFGGLRTANARYSAAKGIVGVYAPGVQFTGPVYVSDIDASSTATPYLLLGSSNDTRLLGGDLFQTNGALVFSSGLTTPLAFVAGSSSGGVAFPALASRGVLAPYGSAPTVSQQNSFGLGAVVLTGSSVDLQLFVNASVGPVSVQWQKNGVDLPGAVTTPDANGIAHYFIVPATPATAGLYTAVATDSTGTAAPVVVNQAQYVVDHPSFSFRHPFPTSLSLSPVVVRPEGGFYLMGQRGYFADSNDGQNWEQGLSFFSPTMGGYKTGNNRHFFWNTSGNFAVANLDGSNLQRSSLPTFEGLSDAAFGQGLFVVVAASNKIFTSPDGLAWTQRTSGTPDALLRLAFGNNTFVASSPTGSIVRSADGMTWTAPATGPATGVSMVRFANDRFFLGSTTGQLFSSPDGVTWTTLSSGVTTRLTDMAYDGNGHYAIVGDVGVVRISSNGSTWTAGNVGTVTTNLFSIAVSNGVWVAVGNGGTNNNALLRSTDFGANWTKTNGAITAAQLNGMAAHDDGTANANIVAVGNSGQIVRSTDGWNWQLATSNTGTTLNEVTYTTAYFTAGNNGTVRTSADQGLNWTNLATGLAANATNHLFWIGNLNGQLHVAGATGNLLRYSGSGTTATSWTPFATGTTEQINGAAYGGPASLYVIVGTNGMIRTSPDKVTWTAANSGTGQPLNEVIFANGQFVAVGGAGTILRSSDGTTWNSANVPIPEAFNHVTYASGIYIASGPGSAVFVSSDAIAWTPKLTNSGGLVLRATAKLGGRLYGAGTGGLLLAADLVPQVENVTVNSPVAGGPATFRVDYYDPLLPVSVQWRHGGINIPGANGPTYTIPQTTRADGGVYDVVLTTSARDTGSDPVTLAVAPTAYPGVLAADPAYTPDPITISTRVYAATKLPSGKWLAGGDFVRWDNQPRYGLARLNTDLSLDLTYTPPVINGYVHALAVAPDGSVYVGGDFTAINGHVRKGIARLTPTLDLDLAWQATDNAPTSIVTALMARSDGGVYVARTSFGNGAINGTNVVRRLTATGALDAAFSVNIAIGTGRIINMLGTATGGVIISGQFAVTDAAATPSTHQNIARISDTGVVDTAFGGATGTNAGNAGTVLTLSAIVDGINPTRFLVGGQFTSIGGQTRNRLAILDNAGAVDATFVPAAGSNGNVYGATALSDGRILAGGTFTTFGGSPTFGLIRLSTAGAVEHAYSVGIATPTSWVGTTAGRNLSMFTLAGNDVALFGVFTGMLNERRVGLAVVKDDGTLAATPAPLVYHPAYNGSAFIEASGKFTNYGSIDIASGVSGLGQAMRVNANGSLDTTYPQGSGFGLNGLSAFGIFRAVRQGDGKTVVVGDLASYNGTAAGRLFRVNANGSYDNTFAAGNPSSVSPQILPLQGGKVLLYNFGSNFTYNGNAVLAPYLRLNADGTVDSPPLAGTGFAGGSVNFVAELPDADGNILVSGSFTTYNGVMVPGIVVLGPDGTMVTDPHFGTGTNGQITGITFAPGRKGVFVSGNFTTFNSVAVNHLALIDPETPAIVDSSFTAAAALDGNVGQVIAQEDGKLIVVGEFSSGFALRLNADGSVDPTFALRGVTGFPGGNASSLRLAIADNGDVYVYNGQVSIDYGPARSVVRFHGAPIAPTIAQQPVGTSILSGGSYVLSVRASGTGPYTYQWKKDGVDVVGATSSILVLGSVTASNAGTYTVVVGNGVGSPVTSAPALVSLGAVPAFATSPANATVTNGGTVTLSVTTSGTVPFTYVWKLGGVDVPNATGSSLTLSNIQASNLGSYTVVASNALGTSPLSAAGVLTSAPTSSAFVADPNFARPEFRHGTIPGRVTAGTASGKLYASFVNGALLSGVSNQRAGALIRLNAGGSYDSSFNTGSFLTSAWAVAEQVDGKVLAGGLASFENDNTGPENFRVWRFTSTGTVDATYKSPVLSAIPRYMTLQPDGKLLVALSSGTTNQNGGIASALFRLNNDGTRDTNFTEPNLGGGGVFATILVDASNNIIIGGTFTTVNGVARAGVARLTSNGTLDTTFVPAGYTFNGGSQQIRGLGLQTQGANAGKILVAGGAINVSGTNRPVIRLNANGSFDNTFTLQTNAAVIGANGARSRLLNVLPDDSFTIVSAAVTRLTANGAIDGTFTGPALSGESFWMETLADGSVVFSPDFGTTVNGTSASNLVRLTNTGAVDGAFAVPAFNFEAYPSDATILPDGKILTWGRFESVGGTSRAGVARFNIDGSLDSTFVPASVPNFYNVSSAVPAADGSVLIATQAGQNPLTSLTSGLTRLTKTGAVDGSFAADASVIAAVQGGGIGMLNQPDGKIVVWSQSSQRVVDGAANATGVFLRRINPNGSLDNTFVPAPVNYGAVFRDASNNISSITLGTFRVLGFYPDGRMLAVGSKGPYTANATSLNYSIVRLSPSGVVDATFVSPTIVSNVSSGFITVTDPVKAVTQQFSLNTAESLISGALPQADGSVIVYGGFNTLGGQAAPGMARLTNTGALDATFSVGSGAQLRSQAGRFAFIGGVTVAPDGKYWVSGAFDTFGGRAAPGIIRLNSDGTVDTTFATTIGFQSYLGGSHKILLRSNNEALVVGTFARTGDAYPFAMNRVIVPAAPAITVQPIAAQIAPAGSSVTLSVTVTGSPFPSFQWRKNGVVIAGANLPTYTIPTASAGDNGSYDVVISTATTTVTSKASILTVTPLGGDIFPAFAWRNPLPNGGSFKGLAFGNSKFVAVGSGGRIFTWDGSTWVSVATVPSISLNAVTYVSTLSMFVAVGASGDIYTAAQGSLGTWTKQTSSTTDALNGVNVGTVGGVTTVVAVGSNGRIVKSNNGTSWTGQAISGTPSFNAVAGGANLFAAVGSSGVLYTSTDATTWAAATAPSGLTSATWNGARFVHGEIVIVGNSGAMARWSGGTWTAVSLGSTLSLRDIAEMGTTYVATSDGGTYLRSTDFTTWTGSTMPNLAILYSTVANSTEFVAVGAGGAMWHSTDGAGWVSAGTTGGIARLSAVEYLNGQFVAVGAQGAIYASLDGDSWTRYTAPSTSYLDSIGFGNGLYVIPTDTGDVLTSSDAHTWTLNTVGDSTNNNGVAFDGTRFVVVGDSGKIRTSTNGTTWTNVTGTGITVNLRSVAARAGLFVTVGDSGKLYTSPDGAVWTERNTGTTNRLFRVRLIDGTFFAIGDSRTVLISSDGQTWAPLTLTPNIGFSYRDIVRLGDGFYFVGDQGAFLKTVDLKADTLVSNLASSETLYALAVGAGRAVIAGEGGTLLESTLPAATATPVIAVQPVDQSTDATKTVLLSVIANASGPITFQWFKDNVQIQGANSSTLLITNAQTTATGAYRVAVTAGGTTVSSATVNVTVAALAAPAIQVLPVIAQATTATATLSVTATGTPPLTYQWYRGLSGDTANPVGTNSSSFTTPVLTNSDRYWVKVTNFVGQTLNSPTTTAVALTSRNGAVAPGTVNGLASSGTVHVAAAGQSILAYDTTAVQPKWTLVSTLTGSTLRSAAYGGGKFVIVGDNGAVRTSSNGTTWASTTVGTNSLNGICYDGTQFVAVGSSGAILTFDGTTWTTTLAALPGGAIMRGITYVPNVGYVAVGDNGTILVSSGGTAVGRYVGTTAPTWATAPANAGTLQLFAVACDDTAPKPKIIVVGKSGTVRISTDAGVSWTTSIAPTSSDLLGIGFGNGTFLVAGNGNNFTSSNGGSTWSSSFTALSTNNAGTNSVLYTSGKFILGGAPGLLFSSSTGAANSWTLESGFTTTGFNDVVFAGGAYVLVGNSGMIARSVDGISYSLRSGPTAGVSALRRVAFGKGIYVAVSDNGQVATSSDGLTWVTRAVSTTGGLSAVAYGNGKFVVAAGNTGAFFTSPDGDTWTAGAGVIAPTNIASMTFGNGLFAAVGNGGAIATSADAVTWTTRGSGTTSNLAYATYGGGKFVAVGTASTVVTSTDGVTWTARAVPSAGFNLTGVAYGDGMYFATQNTNGTSNSGSTIFASLDGLTWNATSPGGGIFNQFSATTVAYGNGAFLFASGSSQITQTLPSADVPRITTEPATQNVAAGSSATLNVVAAGTGASYQWYEGVSGDTAIPVGTNSASFTTPSLVQSKRYWVRVTVGGAVVDSATAQLLGAPTIVAAPASRIVPDGTVVTLSVNAFGASPLTYAWKFNGTTILNANGPSYTINPVSPTTAGNYSVVVSNGSGAVTSSNATISVTPVAPTLGSIASTFGRNIPVGANTDLSVAVTATPPLSYQWRLNGTAIPGATKSDYFITNAQLTHAGTYSVVVTNAQGTATSANFALSIAPELGWQWRNPVPTGNGLSTVKYLNGKFYMGGLRSTMLVSDDGIAWTPRAVPGTGNIFELVYANGRYVALGGLCAMFTSEDGVTWTARDSKVQDASQLSSLAYGNGRFVAVGFNGHTTTSTDGITWTPGAVPITVANDSLYYVRFVEGKFWLASSDDNTVRNWQSTDGLNWTQPALTLPANQYLAEVTFGNNVYAATGNEAVLWSDDGVIWNVGTGVTLNPDSDVIALRFVNGKFYLLGELGEIFTSTDAHTWTPLNSGVVAQMQDIAYNPVNQTFVIAGQSPHTILSSTDSGATWTNRLTGAGLTQTLNAVTTGNGKLVAVGNAGTIVASTDGLVWTAPSSGVSNNFTDVAYGSGTFVAVGISGRIMTAADTNLGTWTNQVSNTTQNLRRVIFANGQFLAVTDSGTTITSPTGVTWTVRSTGTGLAFFGVTAGAGVHVAVGNNGGLFSSVDSGATWVTRSAGVPSTGYSDVQFANNRFVAVGLGGLAVTSTDGITWTQIASFTTDDLNGLTFAGGVWMIPGAGSTYYVSSDAINWTARYTGSFDRLRDFVAYGTTQVIGVGNFGSVVVAGAPTIVANPQSIAARAGATVKFVGLAAASPGAVTYQWQKDGVAISGANQPTLTLTSITTGAAGVYRLVATNGIGSNTSAGATLTVSQAPTFTQQPVNATATAGQNVTFTAVAAGTPAPTYKWQKDGVDVVNGTGIAGATTSTLTLSNVQPGSVGVYTAIATNLPAGETVPISETSLGAALVVNVPPAPTIVSATPAISSGAVHVIAGGSVTFNATSTGTQPLTYQWRINGLNIGNGPNITGANTASMTLANVPLNAGGSITVAATNIVGAVASSAVSLVIDPPAPVIISPLSVTGVVNTPFTYLTAINATTATFAATNLPTGLTINTATGVISGTPTAIGTTSTIQLTATNVTAADTKTLTITINPPPPVITSPVSVQGRVGQALSYTIVATNSPGTINATGLASGLTRTANVISGTPTQAGVFTTTVTAQNATGIASAVVTFTIDPPLNAPVYTGTTQPSGTQNAAFTFTPVFTNTVNASGGYAITNGTLPAGVTLNANTGVISGTPTAVGSFVVTLTATGPGGATSVVLTIVVNPAPTAPVITSASAAAGTRGDPFTFQLTTDVSADSFNASGLPSELTLNPATGAITNNTTLVAGTYTATVSATKNGVGTGPNAVLVITISPSPLAPVITSSPVVSTGRVGSATTLGTPLYQIVASNTPNLYEVTAGTALTTIGASMTLDPTTGAVYGTPDVAGTYHVWFAASNAAGGRGPSMEVTFVIQPPANVPVITSNGTVAGQVGQSFSYAIAATNSPTSYGDGGMPAAWLSRNGNLISGIPNTATVTPLLLTVTASNADGTSAPKTVAITIAPAPATPVITSAGTASGRVGLAFSYQMSASASPTSFNAAGLPPGLTLNPTTGLITGTPTLADTFTVTLSAANTAGLGVTSPLTISIAPAPSAPAITSAASVTGKVGVAFNYTIVASNGPITSYAVTGSLPLGLALNTTTGVIAGSPVAPGLVVVDLTATSANGTSLPQSLIIVINPSDNVPVITSPIYAIATVGADFNYAILATNMPGSTPFPAGTTLDAVHLPAGLAVNPSTGVIQGQPSVAGVYVASLIGTNAAGSGPVRDLTIIVQPAAAAPVVTSVTTAAAQVGVSFAYQISATNSPASYDVLQAPAWMTVNGQSGAIGGTPTNPGTFSMQLVATNSFGASNPVTLTLAIAAAAGTPVVTSSRSATAQVGATFTYTIVGTNVPTSYVATGLPSGLGINAATGAITGTPTSSGTFLVGISANNASGAGQPVTLTLTISPAFQVTIGQ